MSNDTRNFLFGLLLVSIALGPFPPQEKQSGKKPSNENIAGIYEYVYPYNTPDLKENHYLVLSWTSQSLTGLYYGTSDEFDKAREGYLPGFFVAHMDSLEILGDTIRFVVKVNNSDFMTTAIDLKIKSTSEALKEGYRNWEHSIPLSPKNYAGIIKDSATILFYGQKGLVKKTFKNIQSPLNR